MNHNLDSSRPGPRHNHHVIVALILIGAIASALLFMHAVWWWFAPLAFVVAHAVIVVGVFFIVSLFSRKFRLGHDYATDSAEEHAHGGLLIRRPRMYDWLVKVLTFGREKKLRRWTLDLARLKSGDKALDVGCGTGTLLMEAQKYVSPTGTLCGVEPSPEMVAHAQHKANKQGINMEILQASADQLPYAPASFDVVFCTLVLHHLPTDLQSAAIREMRRVLRPGGCLVIADMQTPGSSGHSLLAAISLVTLFHSFSQEKSHSSLACARQTLEQLEFKNITEHSFGSGAVGAIVARLKPSDRIKSQDTPSKQ